MAFRTFRSEAYYEAPAVGPDATEILRAYQNYRAGKVAEQQRRKDLASQYELDLSKGFFESDQKVLDLASQEIMALWVGACIGRRTTPI